MSFEFEPKLKISFFRLPIPEGFLRDAFVFYSVYLAFDVSPQISSLSAFERNFHNKKTFQGNFTQSRKKED